MRALGLCLAISVASGGRAVADEGDFSPDFYMVMAACRMSGSTLGPPSDRNDGFIEMKTDPYVTACQRVGKKSLQCVTVFKDGSKPAKYEATISKEIGELMT